jgi:fatty acid desaturase
MTQSLEGTSGMTNDGFLQRRDAGWHRPMAIVFLIVALGCDVFPLAFVFQHHDPLRQSIAALLCILIPLFWVCVQVGDHKLEKTLRERGVDSTTRQAILNVSSSFSLSVLTVAYSIIIVTTCNLFTCWK